MPAGLDSVHALLVREQPVNQPNIMSTHSVTIFFIDRDLCEPVRPRECSDHRSATTTDSLQRTNESIGHHVGRRDLLDTVQG